MNFRKATLADAAGIARVHVDAWRTHCWGAWRGRRRGRNALHPYIRPYSIFIAVIFQAFLLASCSGMAMTFPLNSKTPTAAVIPGGGMFREYPLPQGNDGLMRPAVDHQGRVWFGEMTRNMLGVFDPRTQAFQEIAPPRGQSGIMGIAVADGVSIWFAEQYANYIGHYFPSSGQFKVYPLPTLTIPDPGNTRKTLSLPAAPNDVAIDAQGNVWFTEFNAGAIGKLNPRTGHITQFSLASNKASAQEINPYGITVDPNGLIWFTEVGGKRVGRLDPRTGVITSYSLSNFASAPMEIASDQHGTLWITTFANNLLLSLNPLTGRFTSHEAPDNGNGTGGVYGVVVIQNDVWVTLAASNAIAQYNIQKQQFTVYSIPTAGSIPLGIAAGNGGTFWFTEAGSNMIGMLQT